MTDQQKIALVNGVKKVIRVVLVPVLLAVMSPLYLLGTVLGIVALMEGVLKYLCGDAEEGVEDLRSGLSMLAAPISFTWQWIQRPKGMFSSNNY